MILQALYQLAQREGLVDDPDFEFKPVAWLVTVNAKGECMGIRGTHTIPVMEEGKKKKPNPVVKRFKIPREPGRTSGARANLLVDKSEYAFGFDPAGKRKPEDLAERLGLFRARVADCVERTGDDGPKAVLAFLDRRIAGTPLPELSHDLQGNDLFAFIFEPDIDRLVTDRPKVVAYWQGLRNAQPPEPQVHQRCLVSGLECSPSKLVPLIKKVPGGTTSGVALVSFNSSAFESFGWEKNENAPISREAAEACSTALNRLLDDRFTNPHEPETALPKRNLRLTSDTVVCYWSAESNTGKDDGLAGVFAGLFEASPDSVGELYKSIWRGKVPDIKDPAAFYALTLSGGQGRAILRGWFESTVDIVAKNLASYFNDLDIVRNTPKPKDHDLPPQLPARQLLESLGIQGDSKTIPPAMAGELATAALSGTILPLSILQRAILRMRAEMGRSDWIDLAHRDARAALIKAVLNRRKRFGLASPNFVEVKRDMDPTNTHPGYLMGRLMAIIERMQQLALGDVNASVVDRYFSGASATPKSVFPRLLKNLRHHVRKAQDDPKAAGSVRWLENQVDEITRNIQTWPGHLDLEEQGLFILGYHHQRAWLWTKKEDREAAVSKA